MDDGARHSGGPAETAPRFRLEGRFLRSRVARRIFLSVVLCSLLPILSFAVLAYHEVTARLEDDAAARLEQDAKQVGMASLERLLLLDATLRVLAGALETESDPPPLAAMEPSLRDVADGRFLAVEFARAADPGAGPGTLLEAFTHADAEVLAHLRGGRGWLRLLPRESGAPRIALARLAPGPAGPRLVAAELDPRFLFATEGLGPEMELVVAGAGGAPIFASTRDAAERTHLGTPRLGDSPGAERGDDHLVGAWDLFLRPGFRAASWTFAVAEPTAVVFAPLRHFETVFPLVSVLSLLVMGLSALVLVRRSLVPIEILHGATRRIAARDFETRVAIGTGDEFQDLGNSFNQMAENIARHVSDMETVNAVGSALSVERDRARLLEAILRGAMSVTGARAGALHLLDAEDRPERMLLRTTVPGEEAAVAAVLDTAALQAVGSATPLESALDGALSIPMRNHEGEAIGVLQLVPPVPGDRFGPEARRVAESLASQTAVALTRDRLAGEFRALFEGLIELLVHAIDEKSPYTGAHCRRVPVLTEMIADAACSASAGPLAGFALSEAERYELRIAALLHDCGKVTTPVHVQDKATKLETLFDRIALVDLRFEVVRRELERDLHAGVVDDVAHAERVRRLESDRAFLHRTNTGGEFMDERDQARVQVIASRWSYAGEDGERIPVLTDEEVENLCIERGTLNRREREIINHHVVATIQMLESLPYPRSLRNVPFIAGCHHERMDGLGYPNQLTREQMSVQARILGLADVFEALTAKDRPYKPGMKISTALEILARMKDEGHIDRDLFDVFVRERVHLRYAARWLDPEQIDEDLVEEAAAAILEGSDRN